jgi:hypothetical protein
MPCGAWWKIRAASTVVDTDVFARILDASGEPVLQNRTRVGSIGDVPPGRSEPLPCAWRCRLAPQVPWASANVKAGDSVRPVRTRAAEDDDLLPLEQALKPPTCWDQ